MKVIVEDYDRNDPDNPTPVGSSLTEIDAVKLPFSQNEFRTLNKHDASIKYAF